MFAPQPHHQRLVDFNVLHLACGWVADAHRVLNEAARAILVEVGRYVLNIVLRELDDALLLLSLFGVLVDLYATALTNAGLELLERNQLD